MGEIEVYFGVFGRRRYSAWSMVEADMGAARIPCRWCVGEGTPDIKCVACKSTREMWIGV